jgi:hypothetical protein
MEFLGKRKIECGGEVGRKHLFEEVLLFLCNA